MNKIKSLIDNPYVTDFSGHQCLAQYVFVSAQRGHPAHRLLAGQGQCIALKVPWFNVGKGAASQVQNRVFIVLRPEGEGEHRGWGATPEELESRSTFWWMQA